MFSLSALLLLTASVSVRFAQAADAPYMPMPTEGSYWAIYNATGAPAADYCIVPEGTAVKDECCTMASDSILPHAMLQGNDTCFSLGPGLIPFSGCVADGVAGYGENCETDEAPFLAADATECGCSFVIEGDGCYKANDLPGQQWFVYLDAASCELPSMPSSSKKMMMHMQMMGKGKGGSMMSKMSSKGKGGSMMSMMSAKGKGGSMMSSKGKGMSTMSAKGKGMSMMKAMKMMGKGMSMMSSKGKGM